jgi:putative membrane protein
MDALGPVIQSFLAGFPVFMLHSSVTIAILVVGVWVYTAITPYPEFAMVRDGNLAVAISLSGAVIGIAIPLAFCMAASVNVFDIVLWGVVTVALQLIAYKATDLLLRDLPRRMQDGEIGAATLLVAIKLAVAAINAAAVAG